MKDNGIKGAFFERTKVLSTEWVVSTVDGLQQSRAHQFLARVLRQLHHKHARLNADEACVGRTWKVRKSKIANINTRCP